MSLIFKIVFIIGIASITALLSTHLFGKELGSTDYWEVHGFILLPFLAIFPRLSLLFSSIPFGGVIWWLGWLFTPRLLVALLATLSYWNTNKFLVCAAWFCAIGGELGEKTLFEKKVFGKKKKKNRD